MQPEGRKPGGAGNEDTVLWRPLILLHWLGVTSKLTSSSAHVMRMPVEAPGCGGERGLAGWKFSEGPR